MMAMSRLRFWQHVGAGVIIGAGILAMIGLIWLWLSVQGCAAPNARVASQDVQEMNPAAERIGYVEQQVATLATKVDEMSAQAGFVNIHSVGGGDMMMSVLLAVLVFYKVKQMRMLNSGPVKT